MTNDKVNEVLRDIIGLLDDRYGTLPVRLSGEELALYGEDRRPPRTIALCHIHALAVEALTMGPERLEKKFRWLGWIQGVLWAFGVQTIEDAKRANMPDEEKKR